MSGLRPNKALFPLAVAFRSIVAVRNSLYDLGILPQYTSALPVICIGNVTVGGSGKTPFVQFLAERLKRIGYSPVILTRGYKGSVSGPHRVSLGENASLVGDEALSHAEKLKGVASVVVSADRRAGAKYIESQGLGDLILLDDGYQHRALKRDINVLLLDVSTQETKEKWLQGSLLPAGWLREPLSSGLQRAQAVVFVSKGRRKEELPQLNTSALQFSFQFLPKSIRDVQAKVTLPTEVLKGKRIIAATGIGEPPQFFSLLRGLGAQVEKEVAFPNHHEFKQSDLESLAPTESCPLFTTTKDAVKLKNFLSVPGRVYSLELGGGFLSLAEEQQFLALCEKAIERKRSSQKRETR